MLRISKLADYGTVIMVYLTHHSAVLCNARVIAADLHIPLPTVSKLLKRLAAANLLLSERGVAGGYKLSRQSADISVADIIYAVEMQRGFTECSIEPNLCVMQSICPVRGNWQLISQAISDVLQKMSLEMLAKPAKSAKALLLSHA